jgi:putative peptidoglycan lipid II flippase
MQILKNTAIISVFTLISQLLGVLRDKLLISIVGVGITLDIYNAAFKIPDLINSIFLSFVGITVIVPFLTSSLIKNNKIELEKKVSTLFYFFNISLTIFAAIIILTLDLFLHKLFPAFSAQDLAVLSHVTKLMLIQPIILGSSNLITCVAQSNKIFSYYAISPVFYNIGVIIGILFFYKNYGVYGLVSGVILGAFFHVAIGFIYLIKYRIDINLKYFNFEYIKELLPIVGWRSIATIMISLKQFSITIVSGLLGAGIITVWTFTLNLVNMCVQFFATSFAIASFPVLSEYYEKGEMNILESTIKRNVREIFLYSIIFSFFMFFLARFVVGIIYNGDAKVLELFYILIVAIPFLNLEQYYARAMMAIHKVKILSLIHVASFIFLVSALAIFYKNNYDYTFIAYSYLIATALQVGTLYVLGQKSLKKLVTSKISPTFTK